MSPAVVSLTSISFAHPEVSVEKRVPLAVGTAALALAHRRLRQAGLDVFVLSTCLRVELAWLGESERTEAVLIALYGPTVPSTDGEVRRDRDAFVHLAGVAAGLKSPMVGEPEVLGQFRKAAEAQRSEGGPGLGGVLAAAIATARTARRSMSLRRGGSLAVVAAECASIHDRVAILGAGAMARAAVHALGPEKVILFSRRPQEVRIEGVTVCPWEEAVHRLPGFPAIISAVGAKGGLGPELLAAALSGRVGQLLWIDLGMPPGLFAAAGDARLCYLDVDDLAAAAQGRQGVEELAEVARLRVGLEQSASAAWSRMAANADAGPVIAAMLGRAEAAAEAEVSRFAGRLAGATDPRAVLRQLAETVAHRVLHPAISYLGSSQRDPEETRVVAEAFGLTDG